MRHQRELVTVEGRVVERQGCPLRLPDHMSPPVCAGGGGGLCCWGCPRRNWAGTAGGQGRPGMKDRRPDPAHLFFRRFFLFHPSPPPPHPSGGGGFPGGSLLMWTAHPMDADVHKCPEVDDVAHRALSSIPGFRSFLHHVGAQDGGAAARPGGPGRASSAPQ